MNKKTFFLVGGLSTIAIAAPLVVVASCATSSTGNIKYLNILAKSTIASSLTEKEVNANPITQQTLNKVFEGITNDNFDQFNSSWDSTSKKITLTAKEGYKFGSEKNPQNKIISAEIKLVTDLNIFVNPKIKESIFILGEVEGPGNLSKETLDKAFTGITIENMANFNSIAEPANGSSNDFFNIVLTAKEGFGFDSEAGNKLTSPIFTVRKSNNIEIGRTLKIANNDTYKNQVKEMMFGKDKPITKEAFNNFMEFTPEENQLISDFQAFIQGKVSLTKEELKQFYINPWIFNDTVYSNIDNKILFFELISSKVNPIINNNPKFKGIFKQHSYFTSILIKNPINPEEKMGRVIINNLRNYDDIFDQATKDMMLVPSNWKELPKLTKKQILINNKEQNIIIQNILLKTPPSIPLTKIELALMVLGISPRSGEYSFVDNPHEDFTMYPSIKEPFQGILPNLVEFKDPANPVVELAFSGKLRYVFSFSKVDTLITLIEKANNLELNLLQITLNDDGTNKVLTPEEQKEVDRIKAELLVAKKEEKDFANNPNNIVSNIGINSITDGPIVIGNFNHYTIAAPNKVLPFGTSLTNTSTSEEVFNAIKNNITIDGKAPTTSPVDIVWQVTVAPNGQITVLYTSKDSLIIGTTNQIIFTVASAPNTP
ncbi:MAG: hypothetical protein ACRCRP_02415 [Metamycoplasmataceae bacterium]